MLTHERVINQKCNQKCIDVGNKRVKREKLKESEKEKDAIQE